MIYIVIIFIFITSVLLIRLFSIKKEMRQITQQLQMFNRRTSNKKIDLSLFDQDIELLGSEINKLIDLYEAEFRKRTRFEHEQKQAIANMSHDLRTPLTSILGYIQLAESDDASVKERKEWLSIAHQRARRLETLLKDFFELSVIESADFHLKAEQINLKHVTIDVLMSYYDRFNEKHLVPDISMPENDVFIVGDESAVMRVIENLLSNAITHSDGNIAVCLEETNSSVKLIVKNDAHALTDQDVSRMFDRFYMADQSRSGKSTGLGLSIVKSFMEKMKGTITGQLHDGQLSILCEWEKT